MFTNIGLNNNTSLITSLANIGSVIEGVVSSIVADGMS